MFVRSFTRTQRSELHRILPNLRLKVDIPRRILDVCSQSGYLLSFSPFHNASRMLYSGLSIGKERLLVVIFDRYCPSGGHAIDIRGDAH